ncbi:HEPN domain-containing protein [Aeromonas rivipollensis]|uniref:HEPN domain-containing protein n=1 Tax=Aeromonas rivipollensis TaxID=948519 RepID=UPI00259E2D7D|nr:HEPN domain-containing protein [Aeromonas rivipollensis]MDM5121866.1 HEPN domain-containing protein [Aeromonas rivipollensis]
MKSEYLITFDVQENLCTTVEKFRSLLVAHSSISFSKKEQSFSYNGIIFPYILAQGTLTDNSIYYDLTIECSDESQHEDYKSLLKEIRKVCTKTSGRNIIILHDGVGEEYCQKGYPIVYRTENLMRKLIAKFMAISIGYDWSDASTPKEVLDSVRTENKKEKTNFLHEVDFIQLSNFLFKKYTKADANRFIDSLKDKTDDELVRVGELKQYSPFTNWEKYFAKKVQCESEYLRTKWEKLYEYRCKIAHCRGISKLELAELTNARRYRRP